MCGDGATSEGDFHEALNFAAVFHLPVVFFVQNNEFAISVPLSRQTAAPSLAHKAIGYGMPGQRVDGNDAAALLAVLGRAVENAREGGGPSLIEAHTYRMQAHTNADDDTRYRERAEVQAWADRDPLLRMRAHLTQAGALDDETERRFAAEAEETAATLRDAMNKDVRPDPEDLFRFVHAHRSPQLDDQWALLQDELHREAMS
jgi:pyruvate dehydrogenase E1 component alpha subunit